VTGVHGREPDDDRPALRRARDGREHGDRLLDELKPAAIASEDNKNSA
jgi:hypothetical protein